MTFTGASGVTQPVLGHEYKCPPGGHHGHTVLRWKRTQVGKWASYSLLIKESQSLMNLASLFRYVDYPVTDILQMIGRANRPLIDDSSECIGTSLKQFRTIYHDEIGKEIRN